jgi:hypothetical protein
MENSVSTLIIPVESQVRELDAKSFFPASRLSGAFPSS